MPEYATRRLPSQPVGSADGSSNSAGADDWKPALLAVGVFVLLWLPAALFSRGFPEADGVTHYIFARFAFQIPANLVNMWGRPVCTALYAVPAIAAGRFGVCAASALIAIGCAVVSFDMARDSGDRSPALALIFTLAQPILFIHTLSAMTELPFALLLGTAFVALGRSRWGMAAFLSSLLPLTRPEGFGFLLIAAGALLWRRKAAWLLVLPLPLLCWDLAGWMIHARQGPWWHWLVSQWPYATQSMYGHGSPLTLVAELPIVVSPLILPAVLLGVWRSLTKGNRYRSATAAVPLFVLVAHSLLYATGKLGSYGEARYLTVAAPFWGVLAGRGWQWCFDRMYWRDSLRWAACAALAPVAINAAYPVIPLRPPADWLISDRVAHWYAANPLRQRYPHLLCSHIGVFLALDLSPSDDSVRDWNRQVILAPPPGTLLVWDPTFGPLNSDQDRAVSVEELQRAGWIEDSQGTAMLREASASNWHIFHSSSVEPK